MPDILNYRGDQVAEAITAVQRHSWIPSYWQWGAAGGKSISHSGTELNTVAAQLQGHSFLCSLAPHVVVSLTLPLMKWFSTEQCALNPSEPMALAWFLPIFFPPFLSARLPEHPLYPTPVRMPMDSDLSFPFSCFFYSICVGTCSPNHKFDWCLRNLFFYSRPISSGWPNENIRL